MTNPACHPSLVLREHLSALQVYPPNTLPIDDVIAGTAFFPGGHGLWAEEGATTLSPWPENGVMIVGQDFDCEPSYRESAKRGEEILTAGTWRQLLLVLCQARIPNTRCFFTNFFMGVRKGNKNTGPHPDAGNQDYVNWCQGFLIDQIAAQRPHAILILGIIVPRRIASLSPDLAIWCRCNTFAQLDSASPLVRAARFRLPDCMHTANVAVLTHPCFRPANVHRRTYAGFTGDEAEHRLIADAIH